MNEIWNEIQMLQVQVNLMAVANILLGIVVFIINRDREKMKEQLKKMDGANAHE